MTLTGSSARPWKKQAFFALDPPSHPLPSHPLPLPPCPFPLPLSLQKHIHIISFPSPSLTFFRFLFWFFSLFLTVYQQRGIIIICHLFAELRVLFRWQVYTWRGCLICLNIPGVSTTTTTTITRGGDGSVDRASR